MSTIVETLRESKINLDHVVRFRPRRNKAERIEAYDCLDANGDCLGAVYPSDLAAVSGLPVVPDTTKTTLVLFSLYDDGTIGVSRMPVLAWRIRGKSAEPICCEDFEDCANGTWCLELAQDTSGRWVFPEDRAFDSIEDATAYARKQIEANERIQAARQKTGQ